MELTQTKTNKKLLLFAVIEFIVVLSCSYFSLQGPEALTFFCLLLLIAVIIYGIRLNQSEKKVSGKKNLVLTVVNIISIICVVFILSYLALAFTLLFLMFSSFGGM